MPLPSVSFLLGLAVLLYLSTFILFALLRIITGVSVQRVGYSGFRRIHFSLQDGIKVYIRGVGLSVHRPTFAQPTWLSLNITELQVVVDLRELGANKKKDGQDAKHANGTTTPANGSLPGPRHNENGSDEEHGRTWKRLTEIKEKIKLLHRKIKWLRMIDLVLTGTSVTIQEVGTFRVERFTLSVDTRTRTVDRSRLFQHHQATKEKHTPAEWKSMVRNVLFTPGDQESTEILDYCTINAHGFLHKELDGLRDASIALKLGRLTIPYDDLDAAIERAKLCRSRTDPDVPSQNVPSISVNDVVEELDEPGSKNEKIVQTVSDSKEFVASILRGIQEIQLAVGFSGLSKRIKSLHTSEQQVYFNLAMKEVGLDVVRLDPKSPAHRMYFSSKDVAHQALLTAISISAGIDDGHEHPERMIYVPMITATAKTTLPSKTIQYATDSDATERNTNILFANLMCTSPSIDLDPKHLPLVLAILKSKRGAPGKPHRRTYRQQDLISRLLPKASIKLSIQEPVIRIALPPMDRENTDEGDFDLLISSTSSMALEVESSHAWDERSNYGLALNYRQTSHQLYYQTTSNEKHDLLLTDTVEIKVDARTHPEASVQISGRFQTFSVFLVRPDICEGIRQIMKSVRKDPLFSRSGSDVKRPSFLRQLPAWLQHCQLQGSDFNIEVAGVDEYVSKYGRGFALQLESWSSEYKAHRDGNVQVTPRRRSTSRASLAKDPQSRAPSPSPRRRPANATDGRRLAIHVEGLEGLVLDTVEESLPETFMTLPRFEVAFSTSTDQQGPVFHINSHSKSLLLQYSLYNHYSIGVAFEVLRRTFAHPDGVPTSEQKQHHPSLSVHYGTDMPAQAGPMLDEVTTVDFKASLIQIKAKMPQDPPLMVQIFGLDAGRHRYAQPFVRTVLARAYAGTPRVKGVWSRIVSIKALRLDFRESKRKQGKTVVEEKSIDLATEAIRFCVPHQLVVHSIFDNITNVMKTAQQLHHHFSTGSNDYILAKHPEAPKKVPRISLRSQVLVFEIEDSPFEWKLGTIYRAGLIEQKQRLAREEAFRLKVKSMENKNQRRTSSRARTASAHPGPRARSASRTKHMGKNRSRSNQASTLREESSESDHRGRTRRMRYDTDGICTMNRACNRTVEQAHERLQHLNAQTWKKRIDGAMKAQNHAMRDMRHLFWGLDEIPEDIEQTERILATGQRPPLMAVLVSDFSIVVDKPSFPMPELPDFLHEVGKGMPKDMKYGLLVPMNVQISMGEARCGLRDYPLPLLHVPAIRTGQSPRLPSLSLRTDFVIAEEFRDIESQRHVNVMVIPKEKMGDNGASKAFAIDVRRTISPVKTYSNMKVEINTSQATRITWGTSYQPAIQDMMQVIEGFTKPAVDPSERVGFWDKIRLNFHSRINVSWKGDGDVHLNLKGSRDPYIVTGPGAGFVMVWRDNVSWNVAQHDDPRRFMTVDSGDYILAIPDFNRYARHAMDNTGEGDKASTVDSLKSTALFKKVIMKLSGNVQWLAGLVFERDVQGNKRSYDFCPHYDVVLKHPRYAKAPEGEKYDAFHKFRSHHIHMSIAIAAPQNRDWTVSNMKPSNNYNTVHLTPRFFTHFFQWWSLFSGAMSLPIRQGPLWGMQEKSSKKFGRHLGTIKYNLLLSPLFISHIYKHKDAEDYNSDVVSATGLKMRLDSFMLDLHQRREFFEMKQHTAGAKPKKTSGMRINQSQLDFINADIRAVSAAIVGTNYKDVDQASPEDIASYQEPIGKIDMSRFTIPDNDFSWIDMDDFVELDWILPAESNPETKILPLGTAPRFTYFRQTDHGDSVSGDTTRSSPFGDEPTHYCVMSARNDPRRVQADLIQQRIDTIKQQILNNERAVGEQEVKNVRSVGGEEGLNERLTILKNHTEALIRKRDFLQSILKVLLQRLEKDDPAAVPDLETSEEFYDAQESRDRHRNSDLGLDSAPLADYSSNFNNRFVVHNAQLKWNNSLRNIILRYIHQVGQRRGFVYYMSRRAVKFILDILEEQRKRPESAYTAEDSTSVPDTPLSPGKDDDVTIQDRIEELLRDGKSFVDADDLDEQPKRSKSHVSDMKEENLATEFMALNTFHFRLIAPQIQLQSEKNTKSAVLVTAKGMQLKVIQIMDKDRVMDDISGLVQRRFSAAMDSLQIFVASTKTFSTEYLHMYSGNRYGARAGAHWPPWVPLEVMFEFNNNPYGFNRVVHRTSASLRYDKYNTLRLKYNDDLSGGEGAQSTMQATAESRMDHLWVEFPQFRAICDSAQYYAMYIIVMDLLLYSEPLEKTRSERLEKIMLASDFSDLTGAPEMVEMLQDRIRQLEEIEMHFQVNEKYLDRQGWKDRIAMDQDLANCEDELFFMMKAITTSQRRIEDRNQQQESSTGLLRWLISAKEIAWHLIREKGESLLEFQIRDGSFDRTDYNDGSNYNCLEIGRVNGYNLLPNALYPEIISPYVDPPKGFTEQPDLKMLRVHWLMLEAIAGIPVVDHFEVDLVPLRVQLEREVAKRLFEYIFPGVGGNAFEGSGFSPFMIRKMLPTQEEEDESKEDQDSEDKILNASSSQPDHQGKQGTGTGAGSLEHRLKPTMTLADPKAAPKKRHGLGISNGSHSHLPHWGLFTHSDRSHSSMRKPMNGSTPSMMSRSNSDRSLALSTAAKSDSTVSHADGEKPKRGKRANAADASKDKERSDDLTQMMNRASSYMTLAYVKIPSMVLCLSYKGRGQRNLEDVHDLVFRMPTLEYRNKTWSNLDLALALKKDVIKALISHAGAIVGNKLSHHRPKPQQHSRLREIANMSTLMTSSGEPSAAASEESFRRDDDIYSPSNTPPRRSFTSGRGSTLSHSVSFASSNSPAPSARPASEFEAQQNSHTPTNEAQRSLSLGGNGGERDRDSLRSRGNSISRKFTGFRGLRQNDGAVEESEER